MTCNLQVILNDNELIPTKKAITVDEPVSLGPLRSETQSHSSSLRPPFSSNLTTCSFHKRKSLLHFVLSFLLLSFTLTLISFLQKILHFPSFSLHLSFSYEEKKVSRSVILLASNFDPITNISFRFPIEIEVIS